MINNKNMLLYIETYGCQMNTNDTAIIQSIMQADGFDLTSDILQADVILLNTCSVRANAENKIFHRLNNLVHIARKRKRRTIIGVVGCMAARLQDKLFSINDVVSLVVGPDEYKKLPELVRLCFYGSNELAVDMSKMEDYNDVVPVRQNGSAAYISIMRGCNNFCSYCIVPYTRGRERSRSNISILKEIELLQNQGVKEICLLGQNVNSYKYFSPDGGNGALLFPGLLDQIAVTFPQLWLRFLTSHPRNMSPELIDTIARHDNICNQIHLPLQSGSNQILQQMNRGYTAEHYLTLIARLKENVPGVAISTDIIAGYPGETLSDHQATIGMLKQIRYSNAFMFRYSRREGTVAFNMPDDVPEDEKIRRLNEIIEVQNKISLEENLVEVGRAMEVLVEKPSKRNQSDWFARTRTGKLVVFDNSELNLPGGALATLQIIKATSATLTGQQSFPGSGEQ